MKLPTPTEALAVFKHYLFVLPVFVVFALLLWPSFDLLLLLHQKWTQWDGAYSHGYLLLGVSVYFIARESPFFMRERVYWPWLLAMILPLSLWFFGESTQIAVLQQLSMVVFLSVLLLAVMGLRSFWHVSIPVIMLFLAVPVWELLTPILRSMTTWVATLGVQWLSIPVFIDGFSFSMPYGTVVVAGSCAGLNYFLMGLVLSSINSQYRGYTLTQSIATVVFMVVLSILGNWIRVFALILIAYYSQMTSDLVYDHANFGWWVFAAVFAVYLFCIRNIPWRSPKAIPATDFRWFLWFKIWCVLLLGALPTAWLMHSIHGKAPQLEPYQTVSTELLTKLEGSLYDWKFVPNYKGFDREDYWLTQQYDQSWLVGRLTYLQQRQGKELISDVNTIFKTESLSYEEIMVGEVRLKALQSSQDRGRLVLYTHIIGRQWQTNPLHGKWLQFTEMLAGRNQTALWYATTQCKPQRCQALLDSIQQNPEIMSSLLQQSRLYP